MPIVYLPERGVIRIAGEDARTFLHGLVTCDITRVSPDHAGYGALLTPQGKIIADFLIAEAPEEDGGGFFLDCLVTRVPDVMKRLTLYKLRAKIAITDMSETLGIVALWDGSTIVASEGLVFDDPRLGRLGRRGIVERERGPAFADTSAEDYQHHRIALGVPEGGKDFAYDDTFPHEALMDQTGGVDFRKGCYVGQEVVSRMEHRGIARSRIVPIVFIEGITCEWGIEAQAGGKVIGQVGSTGDGRGLALLRLDRVADAMAAGVVMTAGGLSFVLGRAEFTRFALPGDSGFGVATERTG